jgi:tRNA(Arg) A34 adenosine deaminase TadA
MEEMDNRWLRAAFDVARRAGRRGDEPFGAVLVDAAGALLLEADNTTATERDVTGHAELNLVREARRKFDLDVLTGCTLYASAEPCAMCAGAIVMSGIRRVVFGLSAPRFYEWRTADATRPRWRGRCIDILAGADPPIETIGPVLEEEALAVHEDSWPRPS